MGNKLQLRGFSELRDELAALPASSTRKADPILSGHANRAALAIKGAYPSVTGALRAGVHVVHDTGAALVARYRLRSTAVHAHLFEFGTSTTRPRATFLPIAEREQRAGVVAVAAMIEAEGLTVTGERD